MIWRTRTARWLAKHGHWHLWFAWRPITLDYEEGVAVTRAWLRTVERRAYVHWGCRYFMYQEITRYEQVRPPRTEKPKLKVVN